MSLLSPRLQLKVAQKQILTPGLVQMVTVLQLNRLELQEMITQEIAENPVLEESADEAGEELTPAGGSAAAWRPSGSPNRPTNRILEATNVDGASEALADTETELPAVAGGMPAAGETAETTETTEPVEAKATDPFDEIDFGSFFDEYLDPGYKSPSSEQVEKPSFETFLSAPVTLADYLHSQLSMIPLPGSVRDAADSIIGNLDENGYLTASLEEIAASGEYSLEDLEAALREVQTLDPAGVGARDVRECLLLQLESRNGRGGVAWQIVADHLQADRAPPVPGTGARAGPADRAHPDRRSRSSATSTRVPACAIPDRAPAQVEPDVYISKDGDDYIIELNDDDLPQLRLNAQIPAHARPQPGAEQGRPQLRQGALRLGASS